MNSRLKFLHRTNRFLTPSLLILLCNALIRPFFDYVCTSWLSNLSNWSKLYLQASQNKCIRFYLQLHKRSRIRFKVFLQLNWLNIHDRYLQFIVSHIFIFFWYFYYEFFQRKTKATFSKKKARNPRLIPFATWYLEKLSW